MLSRDQVKLLLLDMGFVPNKKLQVVFANSNNQPYSQWVIPKSAVPQGHGYLFLGNNVTWVVAVCFDGKVAVLGHTGSDESMVTLANEDPALLSRFWAAVSKYDIAICTG
jgi:hypothetical protein